MRVRFLGTAGYHPNEQRHTSCIMLPEAGVVLDAGTGFFRVEKFLETTELHVFLTHAHLDHIVGITYFLVPMLQGRVTHLSLYGRPQDLAAVRTHLYSDPLFPVPPTFQFVELTPQIKLPGGGRVTHCPLVHPGGSVGYRFDWPSSATQPAKSLAYVTDTTSGLPGNDYADFIREVDLLIHECNFGDAQSEFALQTGHSCTTPVATVAREAEVRRLCLTHIDPELEGEDPIGIDTARGIFPRTEYAADLREIHF